MCTRRTTEHQYDENNQTPAERPDLAAWRRRHALRRSSAATPISGKRRENAHWRKDYDRMEG
jgi:hypothetical protein